MSSGRKNYKGQDQVVQGSPTGEFVVVTRFDYLGVCGNPRYVGEAKFGSKENDPKWHIERYDYSSVGNVSAIKTAINQITTKATSIDVDGTYGPNSSKITIAGGVFFPYYMTSGDRIKLVTPSNELSSGLISEILSDTEIVINETLINEVGTSITDLDLLILLEDAQTKDFAKRRWDLRTYYIYE